MTEKCQITGVMKSLYRKCQLRLFDATINGENTGNILPLIVSDYFILDHYDWRSSLPYVPSPNLTIST